MKKLQLNRTAWHSAPIKSVYEALRVDPASGLDSVEVKHRYRRHGVNRIYAEEHTSLPKYLAYCASDLMLILLLITAATAAVFGEEHAASVIIPILIFSIAVRTFAYIRARRYLEAASSAAAVMPSVTVMRGGAVYRIDARRVVRGDIIRLRTGDIVPCDCRIISAEDLSVYEENITSNPGVTHKTACELDPATAPSACVNMLFAGSSILSGKCIAVAVEIGGDTLAVRSRGELKVIRGGELKLTRLLERYSRVWGAVMTLTVFLITGLNLIFGQRGIYDVFFMGLALCVASMCEYYSAIGDIAAAMGIAALAGGSGNAPRRGGSSVRGVRSIEALADLDAIVFAENGVLTADGIECRYITLRDGKMVDESEPDAAPELFRFAMISTGMYGNSVSSGEMKRSETSQLIDQFIKKNGIGTVDVYSNGVVPVMSGDAGGELAFDVELTYDDGGYVAYMNGGAADIIGRAVSLYGDDGAIVPMSDKVRAALTAGVTYHERRGAAVVGIARKVTPFSSRERLSFTETDVQLVGIIAFYRPLAPDTIDAIEACREAGIRLIMTGSGRSSALAASRVGIMQNPEDLILAKDFASMSANEQKHAAATKTLLIGFDTKQMMAFISLMQKEGLRTAYVGNPDGDTTRELRLLHGVGASFALSYENINYQNEKERLLFESSDGVSQTLKMHADTVIPRATSELGGLPSIVECVSYSKKIYENVAAIAEYLVTSQIARMFSVLYSAVFHDSALSAAQILLWGLIFDFFAVMTIALERPDYKTIRRRSNVYEKLRHPFSGIGIAVLYGVLWGAVTMLVPSVLGVAAEMQATVIFVSVILSLLVVCGEGRSEYSVFSSHRSINAATCLFISSALLLIILITISPQVATAVGVICPDECALLVSLIPAAVMIAVYEGKRFLMREKTSTKTKRKRN